MHAQGQGSGTGRPKRVLYILVAVVTLLLLVAPLVNHAFLRVVYANVSYYLILSLFLVWGACLFRAARVQGFSLRRFVRTNALGIVVSFLVTGSVFLTVEPGYRVLSDETNLITISQAMSFDRTINGSRMGMSHFGSYEPIGSRISKRPLLFPFFVHLLHTALGYSATNAFLLNAITLFGLILIVFQTTSRFLGPGTAVGASLLLVSQPVLTICATSAGFETFTVLFLGIAFLSLWGFLKEPNANTFLLLWVNLLMLAHTRYESPIYVGVILGVLFWFGYLKFSFFKAKPIVYALTPLLLLPILWQRIVSFERHETSTGAAAFGLDHLIQHTLTFFQHQLNFNLMLPYATAVNLFGWVAIGMIAIGFTRGTLRFEKRYSFHFFVMLTACLLLNGVIHLAYHDGDYLHPSMIRYFVMLSIALTLAPVVWITLQKWRPSLTLIALGAAAVCIYHPVAMQGKLMNSSVPIQKERAISAFLDEQRPGFLLITEDCNHYTVHRFGAVNFSFANNNVRQILDEFSRRAYSEIFVAQDVSNEDGAVQPGQETIAEFGLETVREVAIEPNTFVRISRVLPARS